MKKIILPIVLITALLSYINIVRAENSGSCAPLDGKGDPIGNCSWTLDDGTLKFSGQGPMQDYKAYKAPWYEQRKNITSVEIADGITSIGKYSLFQTNITEVYIPASVEKINGLSQMSKLESVIFANGSLLRETGDGTFMYDTKLKTLSLPDGVQIMGGNVFANAKFDSLVLPDSLFSSKGRLGKQSLSQVNNIYCSKENEQKCKDYFETAMDCYIVDAGGICYERPLKDGAKLNIYEKNGGEYYFNGKFYLSPNDILQNNNIKKRIYTVDEAIAVTKSKNTFKIRYK